jgi:glutamate---cysteine ligase / carboxylate-amine ligase
MSTAPGLFSCYGVEIEYMIVDHATLDVRPLCDQLLAADGEPPPAERDAGPIAWSNELVLHVLELKTNGPVPTLAGLADVFQQSIQTANTLLTPRGARLLPTGMHPWMDPLTETRIWPHEYGPVYHAFDRIFGCRGHGWSNLQSTHLNLPFADDDEFGRLHAAVRLLLPVLPGLAASSPIVAARPSGQLDTRLVHYCRNATRIPAVTGNVIPEPVFSQAAYEGEVLAPLYAAIRPHDPDGLLQHEWLNARGAIARFDRGAIEIRLLDTQECPAADLAILALIVHVLQALVEERWSHRADQEAWEVEPLAQVLQAGIVAADQAAITDATYLGMFGMHQRPPLTVREFWRALAERVLPPAVWSEHGPCLEPVLTHGPLARRILAALPPTPTRDDLEEVYATLADCLAAGRGFTGEL